MENLHLNYRELSTIAAALLYRSCVADVTQEWYKYLYDKIEHFMKCSDADNFCLEQLLP